MVVIPGKRYPQTTIQGETVSLNDYDVNMCDYAEYIINSTLRERLSRPYLREPFEFMIQISDIVTLMNGPTNMFVDHPQWTAHLRDRYEYEGWEVYFQHQGLPREQLIFVWPVKEYGVVEDNWEEDLKVRARNERWGSRLRIPSWVDREVAEAIVKDHAPHMRFQLVQDGKPTVLTQARK